MPDPKTAHEGRTVGLEHLFGSRTRVKLLSIFLQNPEEQFFVRQLVRRVGAQIHSVRRELQNLHDLGIVIVSGGNGGKGLEASLRKKYFKANTEFVLHEELQSLLRKAQILLERNLVANIVHLGDVRYFALCGKLAGEPGPTDLLIIGKIPQTGVARLVKRFEREVGYEVNYTLMTPEEFFYRRDIADKFLYAILDGKKMVMLNKFEFDI